jgi:Histidine kinase-like ATPase domain
MSDAIAIDLPLEPESARRAREELEPFRKVLDQTTFFDLRLLVSELLVEVLNAESHRRGARVELRAELSDGRVHAEVADGDEAFRLPPQRPEPGDPGWGIYLVGRVSRRWGLRRGPGRSCVWLELASAG